VNSKPFYYLFLRASRPILLVGGFLTYNLGAGIARYLGETINWSTYWLGLACVTLLQISSYYLSQHFELVEKSPYLSNPDDIHHVARKKLIFLQLASATLTIGSVITVLLFTNHFLTPVSLLLLGLMLILAIMYAVPPFRLVQRGYGELTITIIIANLSPALAFVFQTGDLHRLLALVTSPITFLTLATFLALSLQKYSRELRSNISTLLVRLGWQRGIQLHHFFLALSYVIFISANLVDIPWQLVFPPLLTFPLALFQAWQINQIASGAKPRWKLLSYTSLSTLGLTIYFLSLSLWTN